MAEIGLAVAQTLFAALNCRELKEIWSIWGYESELQVLKKAVTTIKNVLEDAESIELTREARGYIEELKDAVYEADDLFDEFRTLLELNQLRGSESMGLKLCQKVCQFFSSVDDQVRNACTMFKEVKEIQKKLDGIVDNHKKFALGVDCKRICMRRKETYSFVDVKDIIGRDEDKNAITDKLLESENQGVGFLTIVGVGGLGKTALAQLVFNDEKIRREFGDSCFWVCVSNEDELDEKAILCKILEVVTREKPFDDNCSFENIQKEFQENLEEKKYLLVLDDVWNEDRQKWFDLEKLLKWGPGGSRVLVTTRSEITAKNIGDGLTYSLQGLSLEDSRELFRRVAFTNGDDQQAVNYNEMVDIGNRIVEKCDKIPLAIKVVGSLLFRHDINKWRRFDKIGLAQIDNGDNKIMSALKLSYHNLRSSLKSCFSYCAVFPKDFEVEKGLLINLWMAQGYIVPSSGDQSIQDAAEESFSILLQRCFFQVVKKDEYNDVYSVKIHHLMHDVAREVAGEEIQVLSSVANNFGDRTRHVFVVDEKCFESSSKWTNLRSLITAEFSGINFMNIQEGNWRSLRALDLKGVVGESSLESISKMQHLRYLNLSRWTFKELPGSITKLPNLQTLILIDCGNLRQLPHDFSKLVKLSHLDVDRCWKLTCMPLGLEKLTRIRVLTYFVAGKKKNKTEKECDDELKDLGTLTSLTGCIYIDIGENFRTVKEMKDMNGGYLSNIPGLKEVTIGISHEVVEAEAEAVLEKLQPHPNLKVLVLEGYGGKTIPWWGRAEDNWAISIHNLVKIDIRFCDKLVYLPSFSKLPFLKSLQLGGLENLEYMEKTSSAEEATDTTFFPSLEFLRIWGCKKWKGWFEEEGLASLPKGMQYLTSLHTLDLSFCENIESLPEWIGSLSSLQSLSIISCHAIKSLPEGIRNLTSLQNLKIEYCDELRERCMKPDGEDWPKIQHIPNIKFRY